MSYIDITLPISLNGPGVAIGNRICRDIDLIESDYNIEARIIDNISVRFVTRPIPDDAKWFIYGIVLGF
jgi:hypothetical protein